MVVREFWFFSEQVLVFVLVGVLIFFRVSSGFWLGVWGGRGWGGRQGAPEGVCGVGRIRG